MNFKDKVYLVTGSTSGIGQGIAKALLEKGAKVVINYAHNEENAEETRKILENYKNNTLFIKADISDEKVVIDMYKKIEEKFNKLDGLVNNAVYDKIFSIENLTTEEYKKELDVNVVARWMCIKYAIPLLKKSKTSRM